MTDIITLAKSVAELGIFVIIAAAFIYMVYQNWKIKNEKNEKDDENHQKLISDIQSQNNELVEKLISIKTKSVVTPKQYDTSSKIGSEINDALERIRIKTDASRACLIQFHNRTDTI